MLHDFNLQSFKINQIETCDSFPQNMATGFQSRSQAFFEGYIH